MRKVLPIILAPILSLLMLWAAGTFITMDANPGYWHQDFRAFIAMLWLFGSLLCYIPIALVTGAFD